MGDSEFERVHAGLLRFFPDLVCELGGDPYTMVRLLGLDPRLLVEDSSRLSYRAWIQLLELAASQLDCPDFGMRLASLQRGGRAFGPVGAVMRHSKTFGAAIDYVAAHIHAHSLAAGVRLERDRAHGTLFVSHEILLGGLPNRRQAIEQLLLLAHLNVLDITDRQAHVRAVRFCHQPMSSLTTYRAYFRSPVHFEQRADGVMFCERDLQASIVGRDPQSYEVAASLIDTRLRAAAPPLHARVRGLLVRHIADGDCSVTRMGAMLGLHPRTLHRRLRAERQSFEAIKDEVRRDLALRYLQETDHPLTCIAQRLGYAEQSVLSRSCLRWFSMPPSRLRAGVPARPVVICQAQP